MTERAEVGARTPGPWRVWISPEKETIIRAEYIKGGLRHTGWPAQCISANEVERAANAAFIVKACNENADLRATVAALRKALVKMEWSATTRHPLADGHCPTCPVCKAVQISEEHGHKADCALDAALALSTPTGKE